MNIATHIERGRRLFPETEALVFEQRRWTYRELDADVSRLAHRLKALGVAPGDRVALFLPNIPAFVLGYLAAQKLGAIAVSLNVMLKSDEVAYIVGDCAPKVMITTADLRRQVNDAVRVQLEHIIIAEGAVGDELGLDACLEDQPDSFAAADQEPSAPAAILYTSGTTGFPKGATLSQGNITSNVYAKNHYCGTKPGDRLLLFLPLFHCFGQNAVMNNAFNACATLVLQRSFNPDASLALVTSENITMFFGVPTIFILLLARKVPPSALGSVRYLLSAAAPLPQEIAEQWRAAYGSVINEGYGLTETSPFACYNHPLQYRAGSVGMPIENVEVRVVDESGAKLPPGEPGEIVVRGPNVMLGYWGKPEETAATIRGGWLHTGDLGTFDEDGYLYVLDRIKDMINVSGLKVYPAEVENVIYQVPEVAEVAVYGVPDAVMGEMVRAAIVLREGQSLKPAQIIAHCNQRMATYKVPRSIEFMDSLPKNPTGKVLRRVLRERVG